MRNIRFKNITVVFLILLLASCAAMQVAYNNSGLLVRMWVKDHFDLQAAQKTEFNSRFANVQNWHRKHELRVYEKIVRQAESHLSKGVTAEDIHWAIESVRERYKVLARKVAEEIAPILLTLTPAQIKHLEEQFEKDNQKYIKKNNLNASTEKQISEKVKWMKKEFEKWIGNLSSEQEDMIEKAVRESPSLGSLKLAERKKNQHDFVALLHAHHDKHSLQPALQDFLENIENRRSPAFANAIRKTEVRITQLIVQIDKSLSPGQRAFASRKLLKLAQDFHELNLK